MCPCLSRRMGSLVGSHEPLNLIKAVMGPRRARACTRSLARAFFEGVLERTVQWPRAPVHGPFSRGLKGTVDGALRGAFTRDFARGLTRERGLARGRTRARARDRTRARARGMSQEPPLASSPVSRQKKTSSRSLLRRRRTRARAPRCLRRPSSHGDLQGPHEELCEGPCEGPFTRRCWN